MLQALFLYLQYSFLFSLLPAANIWLSYYVNNLVNERI